MSFIFFQNFPFLLPSNGLESYPKYTRSAASPQVLSQIGTDSSNRLKRINQLCSSEKGQISGIFPVEVTKNEQPSVNSIWSASFALRQMAEVNTEQMNSVPDTRFMAQLPAGLNIGGHISPPLPCCKLIPTTLSNVAEARNEHDGSDQNQTVGWMSTQPQIEECTFPPSPCCRQTLPLRHLAEANGESANSDKDQLMEYSPTLQTKKDDCFSLPQPCCSCAFTFPQQHPGNSGQNGKQDVNSSCQFPPAPDLNQTVPWSAHAQDTKLNAKAVEFYWVSETTCPPHWDDFL